VDSYQQFYDVTEKLVQLLQSSAIADRDERITKMNELFDQREALLPSIRQPITDQQKEMASRILKLNEQLMSLLEKEKLSIKKDINSLNHRKESTKKYANPYESLRTDGMYYDKRK